MYGDFPTLWRVELSGPRGRRARIITRTLALTPGTRLGVYEVVAQIGEGGMGEVYRGTDTTLSRQVAIKILPDAFAADSERVARFEREAKTLASLNHPNIAAIYGFEKSGGTHALVMELVEGDDLSQRIARGALPIDEALRIAKQIAEALEGAHEQGIIHRDLKPANIKIRPDGTVKVLDFGLAKAMESPGAISPSVSQAPTITTPAMMTGVGMILGTAAYMSPEQARGKNVDERADIWAFGAVLFEMLTGKRAFGGDDVSEVLSRVLQREPEWAALPSGLPPTLVVFLERCLYKDAKHRVHDIADMRLALEGAFETAAPQAATSGRGPWARVMPWGIAAACVVALAVAVSLLMTRRPGPVAAEVIRFSIPVPPDAFLASAGANDAAAAVSPDGRLIVMGVTQGGLRKLWLRRVEAQDTMPLEGTDNAYWPFWSPDSRSIAFVNSGQLNIISSDGGQVRRIGNLGSGIVRGGTWNAQGVILIATGEGRLMRIAATGGEPALVRAPDAGRQEQHLQWPAFLPDGNHFLYAAVHDGKASARLYVGALDASAPVFIREVDSSASYANGYLLFTIGSGQLLAQPFDVDQRATTGEPVVVADNFARSSLGRIHSHFSAAANGVLAYQSVSLVGSSLAWVDRRGNPIRTVVDDDATYADPAVSPDGRFLAVDRFDRRTGDSRIWLFDLARSSAAPLAPELTGSASPVWTRDSSAVLFSGEVAASTGFYRRRINASQAGELLPESPLPPAYPADVSADGQSVLYTPWGWLAGAMAWDVKGRRSVAVRGTGFYAHGRFSPDGRWVAYQSGGTGRNEVYVLSTGAEDVTKIVSTDGGSSPRWRADGRELFYMNGDAIFSIPVQPGSEQEFGSPQKLFSQRLLGGVPSPAPGGRYFDVAPDGQRFLLVLRKEPSNQSPVSVIVNWPSMLAK